MKKYNKILLIIFLFPLLVSAKSVETSQFGYGGAYNDNFTSVEATSDGGYIAVGKTNSRKINGESTNNGNALIVKFSKDGNVLWHKFYGGNGVEEFYDVTIDSNGNYIAVGYTTSTDIKDLTNKGSNDGLIVKLDKDGNIIWNKLIGGSGDEYIHAVKELSNGNLVIVGGSNSTDIGELNRIGEMDCYIGILTKDGEITSNRLYGGLLDDIFYDVEIKNDNIYAVGYSKSSIGELSNKGLQDCIFVKFNDDLEVEWEKLLGGTKGDMFRGIKNTIDGGFIVVGFYDRQGANTIPFGTSGYIVKYDKNGNEEWSKLYGGSRSDSFEKVEQMRNGDYVVVGKGYSSDISGVTNNGEQDSFIVVYNDSGDIVWNKMIGGTKLDFLTDVTILNNKEFVGVGYAHSNEIEGLNNKGGSDTMIVNGKFHYVITELPTENGSFNAIEENDMGVIDISPDEGYKLDKIVVKDTNNNSISFTENTNDKYYFELYDDVTVKVLFRKDEVENPNTGDSIFPYILVVFGLIGILLLSIRYFSRNINVYEE